VFGAGAVAPHLMRETKSGAKTEEDDHDEEKPGER
jgi:hypothetical protein